MSKYFGIKEQAYEANMRLPEYGLVLFTFGNASAADRENNVFEAKRGSKSLHPAIWLSWILTD